MTQPIIFATRPFNDDYLAQIKKIAPNYRFQTEITPEEASQVEIAIGWNSTLESILSNEHSLKWVQSLTAGVDKMPLKEFSQQQILLSNTSGIHATAIAEHVIGVILGHYRRLFTSLENQQQNFWGDRRLLGVNQVDDKKILIVGTGQVGQSVAKAADALGMQVYGINTTGHRVDGFFETYSFKNLKKVAEEMDIIVNILPLTEETTAIYHAEFFKGLRKSAIFINVGRGPAVVEEDLAQALATGELAFASLDVFKTEPLPADSPLWQTKNLLITPHISGELVGFQKKFMKIFLANLREYVAKQELTVNQVNLGKGY